MSCAPQPVVSPRRIGLDRAPAIVLRLWAAATLAAWPAAAQDVRPGDERIELPPFERPGEAAPPLDVLPLPEVPDFEPPARPRGTLLPPLELRDTPDTEGAAAGARMAVRAVRVVGNTALPDAAIEEVVRPWVGRELGYEDLQALRDALTAAYVERGYVTSGALIPEQSLADGELEIWIVEGRLTEIEVHDDGRLRESYVRERVALGAGPPVNVNDLERALQVLQQDPRIRSLEAQLLPGERRARC